MLPTTTLRPFHYRGSEAIGLDLGLNLPLEKEIRKLKGVRWCGANNLWYVPLTWEAYQGLQTFLGNLARLNANHLKTYLEQRRSVQPLVKRQSLSKARALIISQHPLCRENLDAFRQYQELLILKGYSEKTFQTYTN